MTQVYVDGVLQNETPQQLAARMSGRNDIIAASNRAERRAALIRRAIKLEATGNTADTLEAMKLRSKAGA